MNKETTRWYPVLPADGAVEFPTMGNATFSIRSRHDGHYECELIEQDGHCIGAWNLSPDTNIAICMRKTETQAAADEEAFMAKFMAILGIAPQEAAE